MIFINFEFKIQKSDFILPKDKFYKTRTFHIPWKCLLDSKNIFLILYLAWKKINFFKLFVETV